MSSTSPVARRIHSLFSVRTMAKAIVTLVAAVCLATFAAGGTYALWNSSAVAVPASSIKSGTATLAISTPLALPTTSMYPGITLYGSAVLTNSGDVALAPRLVSLAGPATSNAFSSALVVSVGRSASAADCSAGNITSAVVVPFGSSPAAVIGAPIAKASAGVVCVAVALPASAPNGGQSLSAPNFVLTLDGAQV